MSEKVPFEQIEWIDAESDVSWENMEEVRKWSVKDFIATEVGWIIIENKKFVVITSQIGSDGTIGNRTKIPKKWIISRRKLKLEKPCRKRKSGS